MKLRLHNLCILISVFYCQPNLLAQVNEVPLMGVKHIVRTGFFENNNNYYYQIYFVNTKNVAGKTTYSSELSWNKYNYKSKVVQRTIHAIGDTSKFTSLTLLSPFTTCGNNIIYSLYNRVYNDTTSVPKPSSDIVLIALDTNLNIVLAEKMLKMSYEDTSRFAGCQIQSTLVIGGRIIIGYLSHDTRGGYYKSYYMIADLQGNVLKDTLLGNPPKLIQGGTTYRNHQLREFVKYNDSTLLVTGSGLLDSAYSMFLADTNMNILDTFYFKPQRYFGHEGNSGYYLRYPNMIVLPTSSIIAGSDYVYSGPDGGGIHTCLAKLTAQSRYTFDTSVVFGAAMPGDGRHNSGPGLTNLAYSQYDNRIYYSNAILASTETTCSDTQNYIQVISTDTALGHSWRKFLSPKIGTCAFVTYVAASPQRPGVDVIGDYLGGIDRTDTSLQGSFLFHVDSTGTLDAQSQQHFSIRDRIRIYPNPANQFIIADDVLQGIIKAEVYDMQGKLVTFVPAASNPVRISIDEYPAGIYLLRLTLKDGTFFAQSFSHR